MSLKSQSAFARVGNSIYRFGGVKSLTFAILLVMTSAAVAGDRIGRFCPDCMNEASAQLVAESMAPPPATGPGCGGVIPLGEGNGPEKDFAERDATLTSCESPTRRVMIINQNTGVVFAFNVWREQSLPVAIPMTMTPDEHTAAHYAADLRLAWDAMLEDLYENGVENILVSSGISNAAFFSANGVLRSGISEHGVLSGFEECPTGTALDVYLAPGGIPTYNSYVSLAAEKGLIDVPSPPGTVMAFINRTQGFSIKVKDIGLGIPWRANEPKPVFHVERFSQSELGVDNDALVFELALLTDISGQRVITSQFVPESSRVAGMQLSDFEAGAELDPCSAQKVLDAAQDSGATFHLPPHDPNPSPFPTNVVPPGAGIDRRICTRTFGVRVDGQTVSTHTIKLFCAQAAP